MRLGPLLLVIAVSAGAIGYLEIRNQAAREEWRAETSRMRGDLERAERLAKERADALAAIKRDDWQGKEASAELADLEARILDAATELALLETQKAVARDRADVALQDLKRQVRRLTTIERDMGTIEGRRHSLKVDVDAVESRLQQAEAGVAERQKHAEALDRDIASLAMRRETILSSLDAAEMMQMQNDRALIEPDEEDEKPAASPTAAEPSEAAPVSIQAAIVVDEVPEERDRSRGLYQFGSLSAEPGATARRQDVGLTPPEDISDESARRDDAANWAEDQYVLGLNLLSTAERNSGTRELDEAILAFKAVLGEWPKGRDPMRWAIAQSDLGYALALLGRRRGDVAVLEQAVDASRDALGEFERDETPLLWAAAQHHLGVSLDGLAGINDDRGLREASIDALEQAIATFKDAGAEADAQKAERRLREVYADLPAAPAE